jgi:hypothetical protein
LIFSSSSKDGITVIFPVLVLLFPTTTILSSCD